MTLLLPARLGRGGWRGAADRRTAACTAAGLALLLAGCASTHYRPVSDVPVRIGRPYMVNGITYTPAADPGYDAVGYASWYDTRSGHMTANGERLREGAIAGAHATLPLPSYVEVTALASGRSIVVRVNDRGPFVPGRIVDLSRGAAALLGIEKQGVAPVHVRLVDPPERDRARLRDGEAAAPRPDVPARTLAQWRERLAGQR